MPVTLNPMLVEKQRLSQERVEDIVRKHAELDAHIAAMDALPDGSGDLRPMAVRLEGIEFELQDLWGFERIASMHSHWHRPKACRCDGTVNRALWSQGVRGRAVRRDCPIFGEGGLRPAGVTFVQHIRPGEPDWTPGS
jgi:hypothetical protein